MSHHGCFSGDCPHERETECRVAIEAYCDELERENQQLRQALVKVRNAIIRTAPDTIWMQDSETACEFITRTLGDDWGKDGKCEPTEE